LCWPSGGRSACVGNQRNALIFHVCGSTEVPLVWQASPLAVEYFNAVQPKCSYLKQQVSRIYRISIENNAALRWVIPGDIYQAIVKLFLYDAWPSYFSTG
jgi:hypothetical protein